MLECDDRPRSLSLAPLDSLLIKPEGRAEVGTSIGGGEVGWDVGGEGGRDKGGMLSKSANLMKEPFGDVVNELLVDMVGE